MSKRIVSYPGTFDPVTYGHMDIIERAAHLGDELIVAVAANAGKGPLLSVEDRTELVQTEVRRLSEDGTITTPIRVLNFSTLLTDFAREQKATIIVRGLRAVSDFEIEFQMASINKSFLRMGNSFRWHHRWQAQGACGGFGHFIPTSSGPRGAV